ncbi:MAG: hypothetical protein GXY98_07135 [Erysipelothrix sp.]|nr:hypothetical protein [Erysipelothrix sp.]
MEKVSTKRKGIVLAAIIASIAYLIDSFLPTGLLGGTLIALILDMFMEKRQRLKIFMNQVVK